MGYLQVHLTLCSPWGSLFTWQSVNRRQPSAGSTEELSLCLVFSARDQRFDSSLQDEISYNLI